MQHLFVPINSIAASTITFKWDDWDPYHVVDNPAQERVEMLGLIADRALVAYTIACAEWVVYRFSRLSRDPVPYQFIEAAWVHEVDHRFDPPPESQESEWKGPIRGPIDLALMTVLNSIGSADDGKPEVDAAFAEQIAVHVLPSLDRFQQWRGSVLDRLITFFPRDSYSEEQSVAPIVLSPQAVYDPKKNQQYVDQFLASVDFDRNPFLRSPKRT